MQNAEHGDMLMLGSKKPLRKGTATPLAHLMRTLEAGLPRPISVL